MVPGVSRGYRIRWPVTRPVTQSVTWDVEAGDQLEVALDVMELLPAQEMQALLTEVLGEAGWTESPDGESHKDWGQVRATVRPRERKVTIASSATTRVTGTGQTQEQAEQAARAHLAKRQKKLDDKTTQEVLAKEGTVRAELQSALQKVYERALEKKAASMGEIESIARSENEQGEMEMVIKVRV